MTSVNPDTLTIYGLKEDPAHWEALIEDENRRAAEGDHQAALVVASMYWETDRDAAFARFLRSNDFRHLLDLMARLGIAKDAPLCEVGGGNGLVAWALAQSGYTNVTLVEPNALRITGTGALRERADGQAVRIVNDLDAFYADSAQYACLITRNCAHHFPGLSPTAAALRQKLLPGGTWLMVREQFAETPQELYNTLHYHPYCQRYGVFEFPFSLRYYVEQVTITGFALRAAVPLGYANSCLALYAEDGEGSAWNQRVTRLLQTVLSRAPGLTIAALQVERVANALRQRLGLSPWRAFTRPQALFFSRQELDTIEP